MPNDCDLKDAQQFIQQVSGLQTIAFSKATTAAASGHDSGEDERQNSHRELDLQGVLALCYEALVASERFAQDSAEESHGAEPSVTLLPQSGEAW